MATTILFIFTLLFFFLLYFLKDFICLRKRDSLSGGGAEGEGEADSLLSMEPSGRVWGGVAPSRNPEIMT